MVPRSRTLTRVSDRLIDELTTIMKDDERPMTEILKDCDFNLHSFNHWRRGRHAPSLTKVVEIANFLGYDLVLIKSARPSAPPADK